LTHKQSPEKSDSNSPPQIVLLTSSFQQNLLSEYRTAKLNQEIRSSLEADRDNPEYQSELALWDCVIEDGIHAEG
jgi:hypothetical protein